jgi:hypothetical protein
MAQFSKQSIDSFRHQVTVNWGKSSKEEALKLLVRTARAGHARIMREQAARNGVVPEWEAYANSPGNTNLDSVRFPGPIVYKYRYRREIFLVALQELYKMSPIESGRYRESHTLYIDGVPALSTAPIKPGSEVWIANPLAYARRLEIGRTTSGRAFLVSVPNRIYERVAKILQTRFRNSAKITFGYITVPGAYIIKGRLPSRYLGKGNINKTRRQNVGEPVRSPAIFIEPLM